MMLVKKRKSNSKEVENNSPVQNCPTFGGGVNLPDDDDDSDSDAISLYADSDYEDIDVDNPGKAGKQADPNWRSHMKIIVTPHPNSDLRAVTWQAMCEDDSENDFIGQAISEALTAGEVVDTSHVTTADAARLPASPIQKILKPPRNLRPPKQSPYARPQIAGGEQQKPPVLPMKKVATLLPTPTSVNIPNSPQNTIESYLNANRFIGQTPKPDEPVFTPGKSNIPLLPLPQNEYQTGGRNDSNLLKLPARPLLPLPNPPVCSQQSAFCVQLSLVPPVSSPAPLHTPVKTLLPMPSMSRVVTPVSTAVTQSVLLPVPSSLATLPIMGSGAMEKPLLNRSDTPTSINGPQPTLLPPPFSMPPPEFADYGVNLGRSSIGSFSSPSPVAAKITPRGGGARLTLLATPFSVASKPATAAPVVDAAPLPTAPAPISLYQQTVQLLRKCSTGQWLTGPSAVSALVENMTHLGRSQGYREVIMALRESFPISGEAVAALTNIVNLHPAEMRGVEVDLESLMSDLLFARCDAVTLEAFVNCFATLGSWARLWSGLAKHSGASSQGVQVPLPGRPLQRALAPLLAAPTLPSQFLPYLATAVHLTSWSLHQLPPDHPDSIANIAPELVADLWIRCVELEKEGGGRTAGGAELVTLLGGHPALPLPLNVLQLIKARLSVRVTEWLSRGAGWLSTVVDFLLAGWQLIAGHKQTAAEMVDAVAEGLIASDNPAEAVQQIARSFRDKCSIDLRPDYLIFLARAGVQLVRGLSQRGRYNPACVVITRCLIPPPGEVTSVPLPIADIPAEHGSSMSMDSIGLLLLDVCFKAQQWLAVDGVLATFPNLKEPVADTNVMQSRAQLFRILLDKFISDAVLDRAVDLFNVVLNLWHADPMQVDDAFGDLTKDCNELILHCCNTANPSVILAAVTLVDRVCQVSAAVAGTIRPTRLVLQAFTLRVLAVSAVRARVDLDKLIPVMQLCIKANIHPSSPGNSEVLQIAGDAAAEEIDLLLAVRGRDLKQAMIERMSRSQSVPVEEILATCSLRIIGVDVGQRDPRFLVWARVDSGPLRVLDRIAGALNRPRFLAQPVEFKFEQSEIQPNNFSLYNSLYYSEFP